MSGECEWAELCGPSPFGDRSLRRSIPAVVAGEDARATRHYPHPLYRRVAGAVRLSTPALSPSLADGEELTLASRSPFQTSLHGQVPAEVCVPNPRDARRGRPEPHPHLPSVRRSLFLLQLNHLRADQSLNKRTQAFIENAIAAGGKVLVHCGDGISRSPAVV